MNTNNKLQEVHIRLKKGSSICFDREIKYPEDAVELFRNYLYDMDKEYLIVVNCNANNQPINFNIVSVGTTNGTCAILKECFKSAILSNAVNLMLVHNHPSGRVLPSQHDVRVTDKMKEAANLLGFGFTDHIIVGRNMEEYYSFMAGEVRCYYDHETRTSDKEKIEKVSEGRKR